VRESERAGAYEMCARETRTSVGRERKHRSGGREGRREGGIERAGGRERDASARTHTCTYTHMQRRESERERLKIENSEERKKRRQATESDSIRAATCASFIKKREEGRGGSEGVHEVEGVQLVA
jgi:hypothetical protein